MSKTPLTDNLKVECHTMALRTRGIEHACEAHRKLELERIALKEERDLLSNELDKAYEIIEALQREIEELKKKGTT